MSERRQKRFPSAALVGALVGVVASLLVSPPLMLTAGGIVVWLLVWLVLGLFAGAVVEAIAARLGDKGEA